MARLSSLGIVSAYHVKRDVPHGDEAEPTLYFQWKKEKPYHIDYCFIPHDWADRITTVEIGTYEAWHQHSDHRPLLVDIDLDND